MVVAPTLSKNVGARTNSVLRRLVHKWGGNHTQIQRVEHIFRVFEKSPGKVEAPVILDLIAFEIQRLHSETCTHEGGEERTAGEEGGKVQKKQTLHVSARTASSWFSIVFRPYRQPVPALGLLRCQAQTLT